MASSNQASDGDKAELRMRLLTAATAYARSIGHRDPKGVDRAARALERAALLWAGGEMSMVPECSNCVHGVHLRRSCAQCSEPGPCLEPSCPVHAP